MTEAEGSRNGAQLLSKLERNILHGLAWSPSSTDLVEILEWLEPADFFLPGLHRSARAEPTVERPAVEAAVQGLERLGFIAVALPPCGAGYYHLTPMGKATTVLCNRELGRRLREWRRRNRSAGGWEDCPLELSDIEEIPDRGSVAETFEALAIDFLDLSTRARKALEGHGIRTAGALAAMTLEGLRELRGIGWKSVEEIEMELHSVNLELAGQG